MSAFFTSGSSQRLLNTVSPVTANPFTIGLWINPSAIGGATDRVLFMLGDTAGMGGNASTSILQLTTNTFALRSSVTDASAGTVVANTWFYIVARVITNTNRQISVLSGDGIISTASSAVSTGPTKARMSIGGDCSTAGSNYADGGIAEWWITNTDIQPDGAALQNSTLRQLAYGGPFSLPHIAKDIVDYRSLRSALDSSEDNLSDYDSGNLGRQTWVNTNGATPGPHPPLPGGYRGPNDQIRTGIV